MVFRASKRLDCEKKLLFEGRGGGKVARRGSWEVMKINPIETKFN